MLPESFVAAIPEKNWIKRQKQFQKENAICI
jgi:hypothetical protein